MNDMTTTAPNGSAGSMAMVTIRQAQEVQAAMIVAKKFPRDENAATARILTACRRKSLAQCALYEYPRGGTKVTGPSIRLAEVMAQSWGNLDYGVIELEQRDGQSVAMAYAWDLETNMRRQLVFTVPHVRETKSGNKPLTDPRDIYELVANMGARRVRACILGVIPGDIQDLALQEIDKTLKGSSTRPLGDRVKEMVALFGVLGVTPEMIESKLGHNLTACTEQAVITLGKVYVSIRDGMSTAEDHFEVEGAPKPSGAKKGPKPAGKAKNTNPIFDQLEQQVFAATTAELVEAAGKAIAEADIADGSREYLESLLQQRETQNASEAAGAGES